MKNRSQTSVILVHGAFADATIWQKVLQLVEKAGLFVTAVQLALKSIAGGTGVEALLSALTEKAHLITLRTRFFGSSNPNEFAGCKLSLTKAKNIIL